MTIAFPIAPLWRRLAALVYDSFLLFGLYMLYGYAVVLVESRLMGMPALEQSPSAGGNPWVFIGLVLVTVTFYSLFWLKNGQTLGMQAWQLQIATVDGQPLTLKQCLLRCLMGAVSLGCFGLGYFYCLLPGKHTWHDRFSRTRIIVHPKRREP